MKPSSSSVIDESESREYTPELKEERKSEVYELTFSKKKQEMFENYSKVLTNTQLNSSLDDSFTIQNDATVFEPAPMVKAAAPPRKRV